jgi:hypothetical protein
MDLNEVLSDEPEAPVVETPAAEAPATEAKTETPEKNEYSNRRRDLQRKEWAAQGRDPETGQFIPKQKEEPKVEEPKPEVKAEPKVEQPKREEFTEKERAFLRAAEEERRKRQELERRLAELEKPKPAQEDKKTFWDDPEGHLKSFETSLEQKLTQREMNVKLATAEAIARTKYKDFDNNVQEFAQALQATPGLRESWLAAPDPAEFAYRFGERTRMIREAGSLDSLMEKIEKETRAKLEAEFKAKQKELEAQREALTPSLSDVRGAAKREQPVYTGPTPLDDILKGK